METKTSVPHKIVVIGGRDPIIPVLTEAARAAGIKPQPYYRLQLVPVAILVLVDNPFGEHSILNFSISNRYFVKEPAKKPKSMKKQHLFLALQRYKIPVI